MKSTSGNHTRRRLPAPSKVTLVIVILLVVGATTLVFAKERVLQKTIPVNEVNAIVLDGGNGSAHISVGADDTIQIRVEIRAEKLSDRDPLRGIKKWFLSSAYDDLEELMKAIRLEADPSPTGKIKIGLEPPVRTRESQILEDWYITVPQRLAVKLAMARATTEVEGVAGGVDISLGNGSVDVDVPGGDLDIVVTVGKARVRTGSESVGKLSLRSQVGNTDLSMNGMKMKYSDPPGPGSGISLSGKGQDTIRIYVQVGDASLRVNE